MERTAKVYNTMHSRYVIDREKKRFSRQRMHPDASVIRDGYNDSEWQPYDEYHIVPVDIDYHYVYIVGPDGYWIRSTRIISSYELQVLV